MLTGKHSVQCCLLIAVALIILLRLQSAQPADGTYVCYDNADLPMLTIRDGRLIDEDNQYVMDYSYLMGVMYLENSQNKLAMMMIGGDDCLYTPWGDVLFKIHRFERIW